jgi:hypothetical protein
MWGYSQNINQIKKKKKIAMLGEQPHPPTDALHTLAVGV